MMKDCIFCKIITNELDSHCIYEDEFFKVILDIFPASVGHTLILTKAHYENAYELGEREAEALGSLMVKMTKLLQEKFNCNGLNVVQNNGALAGQVIFHYHMHLTPRYENDGIIMKLVAKGDAQEMVREAVEKLGL